MRTSTNVTSDRLNFGGTILLARRCSLDGWLPEVLPMREIRRVFVLLSAAVFGLALLAHAQDEPSLGDVARQARQQKQQKDAQAQNQNKDAPAKDAAAKDGQTKDAGKDATAKDAAGKEAQPAKAPKVITNDEIPEHIGPTRTLPSTSTPGSRVPVNYAPPAYGNGKLPAEYWKNQIQAMKNYLASTQSDIDRISESIHFAGGNCVSNCVEWNERQQQKLEQVEALKGQLEEQKKRLEDMQESARRQGFGSSVYDP